MTVDFLKQWWILQSYESIDDEDEYLKEKLKKKPMCRGFVLEYGDSGRFVLKFEWYSKVKKNDWMRVERTTDLIIDMYEENDLLTVKTSTSKYVFQKLEG